MNWFASRQPQWPHCQSISRTCPLTCRQRRGPRPSLAVTSSSQNAVSRGLIAPIAASFSSFWTCWMIVLRSSPCSFPDKNCILIVLNAPRCRNHCCQLLYHVGALQLSFPPFFSTLSKRYAIAEGERLTEAGKPGMLGIAVLVPEKA